MSFSIEKVVLTNFKSFIGTHEWILPTEPGLYFITGQNLVEASLDRCGCGKTTLLDAISWALTGCTTRGQRGPDVVADGHKGCSVVIYGSLRGQNFEVVKTQSPNSLTLDGKITDQVSLTEFLGLNHEAFCYSVILPQFGDAFLDLTPALKLSLFNQIMELDYWLQCSAAADEKAKINLTNQGVYQKLIEKDENSIKYLQEDIKELTEQSAKWSAKQQAKIKALKSEYKVIDSKAIDAENEIEGLSTDLLEIQGQLNLLGCNFVDEAISEAAGWVKVTTQLIRNLHSIHGECPLCQQPVPDSYKEKEIDNQQRIHSVWANKVKQNQGLKAEITAIKEKGKKSELKIALLESDLKFYDKQTRKLESDIKAECAVKNEFEGLIEDKKAKIELCTISCNLSKSNLDELKKCYEAISFWVSGFKRIRLLVIEQTLRTLEVEINNVLTGLGLTDWRIELNIERENKNGGVTKGFSVLIHEPNRKEAVSWDSWSGGETQFLRLAGALGLSSLIVERAGIALLCEFYDEVSQHLPPKCVGSLLEVLHYRAHSLGKRIFVIDHNSYDTDIFDGQINIIKNENGSHIEGG